MKVKTFSESTAIAIELVVNKWISARPYIQVKELQFTVVFYDYTPQGYRGIEYSCFVMYDES